MPRTRLSDGTITVEGVRYELLAAYRTLLWVNVCVARWDLSSVDLVDPRGGAHLSALFPLDRETNADRRRRALPSHDQNLPYTGAAATDRHRGALADTTGVVQQVPAMADYAATGLPPAYLTKEHAATPTEHEDTSAALSLATETQLSTVASHDATTTSHSETGRAASHRAASLQTS